MPEFRISFNEPRGVNITADTEDEAKEVVRNREWEYGMDYSDGEIEIIDVTEI